MSNPAIYTECTPIHVDGQDMTEAVILSDINNRDKNAITSTVLHFFVFIICILFSGILTPVFFNLMKANSGFLVGANEDDTLSTGIQIAIILLFLGYAITVATVSNNLVQTTIGSFMFIYVFVSGAIMYFLKTISPAVYSVGLAKDFKLKGNNKLYGGAFFSALIVGLTYLITSRKKDKNKKNKKNKTRSLFILIPYGALVGFLASFLFIPDSSVFRPAQVYP